jgi:hypothetical protein
VTIVATRAHRSIDANVNISALGKSYIVSLEICGRSRIGRMQNPLRIGHFEESHAGMRLARSICTSRPNFMDVFDQSLGGVMKLFSRIALALFLTAASAFAEEVVPTMDSAERGIVPDVEQAQPAEELQVVDAAADEALSMPGVEESSTGIELASVESTSSSHSASIAPAPWSDTMSAIRTGGSPEGTRSPNELHDVTWSEDKILIGAGVLLLIILLIVLID